MPKSEGDLGVKLGKILEIAVRLLDIRKVHKCSAITFFDIAKIGDAKSRVTQGWKQAKFLKWRLGS